MLLVRWSAVLGRLGSCHPILDNCSRPFVYIIHASTRAPSILQFNGDCDTWCNATTKVVQTMVRTHDATHLASLLTSSAKVARHHYCCCSAIVTSGTVKLPKIIKQILLFPKCKGAHNNGSINPASLHACGDCRSRLPFNTKI